MIGARYTCYVRTHLLLLELWCSDEDHSLRRSYGGAMAECIGMKTERGESFEKGVNHDSGTRRQKQKAKLIANLSRGSYSSKYVSSGRSAPDMQAPACLRARRARRAREGEEGKERQGRRDKQAQLAHWQGRRRLERPEREARGKDRAPQLDPTSPRDKLPRPLSRKRLPSHSTNGRVGQPTTALYFLFFP